MQPDPSGLGPDTNPYRFVGNSPTNFIDPSGMACVPNFGRAGNKGMGNLIVGRPDANGNDPSSAVAGAFAGIVTDAGAVVVATGAPVVAIGGGSYLLYQDGEARRSQGQSPGTVLGGQLSDGSGVNSTQGSFTNRDLVTQKNLGMSNFDRGFAFTTGIFQIFGLGYGAYRGVGLRLHGSGGAELVPIEGSPRAQAQHTRPSSLVRMPANQYRRRSTEQVFTPAERAEINRIGQTTGCHTCGKTSPGTKSGNFVPDHQPVSKLSPPNTPQRLYPQCLDCSKEQGLAVARQLRQKQ